MNERLAAALKYSGPLIAPYPKRVTTPEQRRAYRENTVLTPVARMKNSLRCRVGIAMKKQSGSKAMKTMTLIGCTVAELRDHLEAKFQPGMTWENYGKWHVDHIRPCASFDLLDPGEQVKCFHFTNLQPLWAAENHAKGAKWSD